MASSIRPLNPRPRDAGEFYPRRRGLVLCWSPAIRQSRARDRLSPPSTSDSVEPRPARQGQAPRAALQRWSSLLLTQRRFSDVCFLLSFPASQKSYHRWRYGPPRAVDGPGPLTGHARRVYPNGLGTAWILWDIFVAGGHPRIVDDAGMAGSAQISNVDPAKLACRRMSNTPACFSSRANPGPAGR
jgi:hypothetical protein